MTNRKDFEAMLEALINEDQKTAKEIFHNIVVERSRQIYEELLAEEFSEDSGMPYKSKEEEEGEEEEEEGYTPDEEEEEEEEGEGEEEEEEEDYDFDDGEESDSTDEDLEDRVLDLEDALEDLKAEFEELMAGEGEPTDEFGDDEDEFGGEPDEFGSDEEGEFGDEEEEEEEGYGRGPVLEYTQKVTVPKGGDDGVNRKSVVAKKTDMGGTASNFAKTGSVKEGSKGGLLDPNAKEEDFGNVNVPGSKKATKLSAVSKGHGAEKKGASEQAANKKAVIGGGRKAR